MPIGHDLVNGQTKWTQLLDGGNESAYVEFAPCIQIEDIV